MLTFLVSFGNFEKSSSSSLDRYLVPVASTEANSNDTPTTSSQHSVTTANYHRRGTTIARHMNTQSESARRSNSLGHVGKVAGREHILLHHRAKDGPWRSPHALEKEGGGDFIEPENRGGWGERAQIP